MSDPKRAILITVRDPKSAKNNVNKTVRLAINLDESNESKYPELNYKELVIAEDKKKHNVQNGKTVSLSPNSENDEDLERVARKFEQKYGGKSKYYGRKGRSKQDDFADIGAGYDENDSFIDNTHGYDEMIPPECDTLYGGFYINSGSLEFKTVPQDQVPNSDEGTKRNKRRISSSSSAEESSDCSSGSESQGKNSKTVPNGAVHSHKTDPRKKKNKGDKKTPNKVRRTDSSAANSGKQTSDDNVHVDGESVESQTSQSDSLTSTKPAPSSENAITSDSSRDVESKTEVKLPSSLTLILESIESSLDRYTSLYPAADADTLVTHTELYLLMLDAKIKQCNVNSSTSKAAWSRAARVLGLSRNKLMHRIKTILDKTDTSVKDKTDPPEPPPIAAPIIKTTNNKRKRDQDINFDTLSDEQREAKIVESLAKLRDLIEERKPGMLSNYNAECQRVQEERKKLQLAAQADGSTVSERRLPKRRFPWCTKSRELLGLLANLAGNPAAAANLLATRALPLFPSGFVRMPTLLRQADLSKEVKASDVKRQRLCSTSNYSQYQGLPTNQGPSVPLQEPIQFPSSLTVTTTVKTSQEKTEQTDEKYKSQSLFGTIAKSFSLNKDSTEKEKEDSFIPLNNIGSITITPVPHSQKEKKSNSVTEKQPSLIRVKSPAALNEMVTKKDVKVNKLEKPKDKRVESPLHIDISFQPSKKDPSPKDKKEPSSKDKKESSTKDKKEPSSKDKKEPSSKDKKELSSKDKKEPSSKDKKDPSSKAKDEVTQKQINTMKIAENNIPRPTLIPVHHSPTFAKPDKRPIDGKKKKDIIVVTDIDPLSNEPMNVDDSSSDVEVIETDKSDSLVPCKDKNSVTKVPKVKDRKEEVSDDIDTVMRNIREMEMAHSQEPTKFSNAFSDVIMDAQDDLP